MSIKNFITGKNYLDTFFSYGKTFVMGNGIQNKIAIKTGLSATFVSLLINGKRRPSWRNAKKIAAVTNTEPILWMEGSPKQMQKVLADLKVITRFDIKARKKVSDICRAQN